MYPDDNPPATPVVTDVALPELVSQVYESAPPAVRSRMLAQLVAQVYEAAPLALRGRLLEQLMQPLGVLSLVAVANGMFASMRFRAGWPDAPVRLEDAQNVRASDVMALVDHVQQVSMEALHGVARIVSASPVLASSAAAAMLVTVLLKRARQRRAADSDEAG
jgi:hypothetical protein